MITIDPTFYPTFDTVYTRKESKNDSSVMDDPTGSFGSAFIRWVVCVQTITLGEGSLFYGLSVIGPRKQTLVRVMHMCRLQTAVILRRSRLMLHASHRTPHLSRLEQASLVFYLAMGS